MARKTSGGRVRRAVQSGTPPQGHTARPVHVLTEAEWGRRVLPGIGSVYAISSSELRENGGKYRLLGGPAEPMVVVEGTPDPHERTELVYVVEGELPGAEPEPTPFVGAYDFLGSDLVHLYAMRRGRSDYVDTEPLVRIRNNSTQAEQDFTAVSGGEDLDTAAISTFLAGATGTIVTEHDQVGGDDVTQGTAGAQPLYVANGQNGHPVPRYDGTGDYLQGPYTNGGALSQPFSVLVVAQLDASVVGDGNYHFIMDGDDSSNRILMAQRITSSNWYFGDGNVIEDGPSDANWNVWVGFSNGATSEFWINGASKGTGNVGLQNPDGIAIGTLFTTGGGFWKGDIPEIAIVDPSMSDADRQTAEQAAADYWGITIA